VRIHLEPEVRQVAVRGEGRGCRPVTEILPPGRQVGTVRRGVEIPLVEGQDVGMVVVDHLLHRVRDLPADGQVCGVERRVVKLVERAVAVVVVADQLRDGGRRLDGQDVQRRVRHGAEDPVPEPEVVIARLPGLVHEGPALEIVPLVRQPGRVSVHRVPRCLDPGFVEPEADVPHHRREFGVRVGSVEAEDERIGPAGLR
jgi:hypothetical protein